MEDQAIRDDVSNGRALGEVFRGLEQHRPEKRKLENKGLETGLLANLTTITIKFCSFLLSKGSIDCLQNQCKTVPS